MLFSAAGISFAWELILLGHVQETYDDNINSSITDKRHDFISEFTAGLGVRHEGKTQTLDIIGHVIEQVYSMNFGLTNNAQDAAISYTKAFTEGIGIQISDIFQNYPEPDRFAVLFGHTHGRMRYYSNTFSLGAHFDVNKYYTITLAYTNQYNKYFYTHTRIDRIYEYFGGANNNQQLESSFSQGVQTQHQVHWTSSNMSFIYYNYQWVQQNPGGVSQVHTPGAGHRLNFTNQLYTEFRIAPDLIIPAPQVYQSYLDSLTHPSDKLRATLFTSLSLVNDVDRNTNASLVFSYQNTVMTNTTDIVANWQINGNLSRHVFPWLSLMTSIFYGQGVNYAQNATNMLFGFLINAGFEFTEHVSATVSYNITLNYTEINGLKINRDYVWYNGGFLRAVTGYYRNRVSLGLTAQL